jgi:hypothetical protein
MVTQAATAHELARHVGYVVAAYKPGAGTSEMYVAGSTMMVVEGMLTLIMQYVPGPVIRMDRNTADTSGATGGALLSRVVPHSHVSSAINW